MERRRFLGGVAAIGGALLAGCAGAPAQRGMRGYNVRVIDAHAHWHSPEFVALLEQEGAANGAKMGRNARGRRSGSGSRKSTTTASRPRTPATRSVFTAS